MKADIQFFIFWNSSLSVYTYQVSSPGDGRGVTLRIGNLSICFLFVFVTSSAFADAVLDEAHELMGRQQAAGAFALLDPLEEKRSGDPEFDYLLGIAALDSGEVTRAIFALERVIAVDHDRARAELGRAHFVLGERELARRQFETVKQRPGTPAEALVTIDKYLEILERTRVPEKLGTSYSGYVDVSIGYDSNINSATDESSVLIPILAPFFGGPFPLPGNAVETDHAFTQQAAAVDVVHAFTDKYRLIGGARGVNRLTDAPFSTRDVYGYFGASMDWGRHRFTLAGTAEHYELDYHTLRRTFGGLGQWSYDLDDRSRVNFTVHATTVNFVNIPARDSDRFVFSLGYIRALRYNTNPIVYATVYGGIEDDDRNSISSRQFAHDLYGGRIGGSTQLPSIHPKVRGYMNLSVEQREYHGQSTFFFAEHLLFYRQKRYTIHRELRLGMRGIGRLAGNPRGIHHYERLEYSVE